MSAPLLFDPALVRRHINRATPNFAAHRALFDASGDEIIDRITDVKKTFTAKCDLSPFPFLPSSAHLPLHDDRIPTEPNSFDLIASNLALHWVNDVPGVLMQIHAALKPDGLFIASLIGEQSLGELRACLTDAEIAVMGGISPRLSPTIDLQTASVLMQRAGFTLPVADKETVTIMYPDMFALMRDLRGMGQTNAHSQRLRHPTKRAVFTEAARLYQTRFGDENGHIPACFDLIYLHGWK